MLAVLFSLLLAVAPLVPPVLPTAHAVRSLPLRDAEARRPVSLVGTVTFCPPRGGYFYLQDATGGVRVDWLADRELKPGERVKVRGETTGGSFLPEVRATKVDPHLAGKPLQR